MGVLKVIGGLVLGSALLFSTPTDVAAQTLDWPAAQESLTPEQRLEIETWAFAARTWGNQHVAINTQTFAWFGSINMGINQAMGSDRPAPGDQWGPQWVASRRAAFADIVRQRDAIPPMPPRPVGLPPDTDAALEALSGTFHQLGENSASMIRNAERLAGPVLLLAEGGPLDDARRLALARAFYDLNEGLVLAENDSIALSMASFPGEHPQVELGRSSIATNQALVEYLRWQEATRLGDELQSDRRAMELLGRAAEIRAAADRSRTLASAFAAALRAEEAMYGPSALNEESIRMVQTYEASATVEEQIAGQFEAAAAAMLSNDAPGVELRIQAIMGLIGRRLQLDAIRRADPTGQ